MSAMIRYTVTSCTPLNQLARPLSATWAPIRTARKSDPISGRLEAQPANEEGDAERERQVREDRADDRRSHHVEEPRAERYQGDDQLGRIAEGGVEEPRRRRAAVLERERDRNQREQPVDRGLHGREAPSGAAGMGYAAARRRARAVQMRPSSQ
jgi:hypothetical protein